MFTLHCVLTAFHVNTYFTEIFAKGYLIIGQRTLIVQRCKIIKKLRANCEFSGI